jgi:hypothetical protein
LPRTTSRLVEYEIDGAREKNDEVRQMLLASYFGGLVCMPDLDGPAAALLELHADADEAAAYFTPSHLDDVRSMLTCGRRIAGGLQEPYASILYFTDDENKSRLHFDVFHLRMDRLPSEGMSRTLLNS